MKISHLCLRLLYRRMSISHFCLRLPNHTCIHTNSLELTKRLLLYEKKQERFLCKVTNITNNKRLRRIERKLTQAPDTGLDDVSEGSARFIRKRRRKVIARKRAGAGGTYMKRLKLASDSLKNTDPELGTVLNMDSILAFQGGSAVTDKNKVVKKGRGRGRRAGVSLSTTEKQAVQMSAKQAVWKMPRYAVAKECINPLMSDIEIERRKNELYENIQNIHTTLSIEQLLAQPRRRGFRPSRVLDQQLSKLSIVSKNAAKAKAHVNLFTTPLALVTPSNIIPASISRRQMAENNKIFQLTVGSKKGKLNIDDEIALLGSYAGLTRSTYLRGDEVTMMEKRKEYNMQLEKLYRKKLNLKKKWINVMHQKRRQTDLIHLPKNAPMMPLIPGLQQRIDRSNNINMNPKRRTVSILHDIMKLLPVNEIRASPPNEESIVLPPLRQRLSLVDYQNAMNLPKMSPADKKADILVEKEAYIAKHSTVIGEGHLPPINQVSQRRRGMHALTAPDIDLLLGSQSTPNLPEARPNGIRLTRRRSLNGSIKEGLTPVRSIVTTNSSSHSPNEGVSDNGSTLKGVKATLDTMDLGSEVGFKMNIFLSGLSKSNNNVDQSVS